MEEIQIFAPSSEWPRIRDDPRFIELMRLARVANSLALAYGPLQSDPEDQSVHARREPTLGTGGRVEPILDGEPLAARVAARLAGPRLDALVDTMATLQPEAAVSGDAAIQHLPPSRRAGTKPVLIEGLNSASDALSM